MDIIFCHFLMLYQIYFSPHVKRSTIVSNKHSKYESPYYNSGHNILRFFAVLTNFLFTTSDTMRDY